MQRKPRKLRAEDGFGDPAAGRQGSERWAGVGKVKVKGVSRKALGRAALRRWRSGLPESTARSGQSTSRRDAKAQRTADKTSQDFFFFALLCGLAALRERFSVFLVSHPAEVKGISRRALGRAALRRWRSGLPESTAKSGQSTSRRGAKPLAGRHCAAGAAACPNQPRSPVNRLPGEAQRTHAQRRNE